MRVLALLLVLFAVPALAQDTIAEATEDRGRFIEFIENQLNTDNRIIRVSGIEGALSSQASIDLITVADREGVWLRLENSVIDWSRRQLLRGRLDIERLAAERIELLRTPLADPEALPSPEAGGFTIPELPLSIEIEALEVGELFLGEPLFGEEATVAIAGSVALADGGLDARLTANRVDGPGGTFGLALAYAPETDVFTVDLVLDEPADGIVANLAEIEGRPPVRFAIQGEGPLDDLTVAIALDANEERLLEGSVVLRGTTEGRRITADLDGALGPLLPATVRDFVGASSTLDLVAIQRDGGGLTVERAALDSGEVQLEAAARTTVDGFLELLDLEARVGAGGERTTLPGGTVSIGGATVSIDYGTGDSGTWSARAAVDALDAGAVSAGELTLDAQGTLENAADPELRSLTFEVDGDVREITSPDPATAAALGSQLRLDIQGGLGAGGPVRLERATLTGRALRAVLSGVVEGLTYRGDIELSAASLAPFSALAGRELAGALALDANGTVSPVAGGFDLVLDGNSTGLQIGVPAIDGLLGETVDLQGRLARDENGVRAGDLRVDGQALGVVADGQVSSEVADFNARIALDDLSAVSERLAGRATIEATIAGTGGAFDLAAVATVPRAELDGRELANARVGFDGRLENSDVRGALTGEGAFAGEPVTLSADLATLGDIRQLDDLELRVEGATITGAVRQNADGLFDGEVRVSAESVATLAALALTEAEGSVELQLALDARGDGQAADVSGTVDDLVVGDARVGEADVEASVSDLFGVPAVNGRVDGAEIAVAGVTVEALELTADGTQDRTLFSAEAELAGGVQARLAGALSPLAVQSPDEGERGRRSGFALTLDRLSLDNADAELELLSPTSLTVADGVVTLDRFLAALGEGQVTASGSVGERIDLSLDLDAVDLDVINAVRPDLDVSGTVQGSARVEGTRASPEATFELAGRAVSFAQLREGGIEPLVVDLAGAFAEGTLRVRTATVTNEQGVRLEGNAVVPILEEATSDLAANVAIASVPLSLANGFVDDLGASGTVAGMASVSGTLASPEATFNVMVDDASARALRDAGVEPLALRASGSFADTTLRLSNAELTNPQGVSATAMGTVPIAGPGLDLKVELVELPAALAGVALPDLAPEGRITGSVELTGTLREPRGAFDVAATELTVEPLRAANVAPVGAVARGSLTATGVVIEEARVTNEDGVAIVARGTAPLSATGPIELDLDLADVPLAIANAFVDDLALAGSVGGTASVEGTVREPSATFDVTASDLTAAPLANAGIDPLQASAVGTASRKAIALDALSIQNAQGVRVSAGGEITLDGEPALALDVDLRELPLGVADAVLPELGLRGTASGTASIAGPLAAPQGTFDVALAGLTAAPLASNGIAPLDIAAAGELAEGVVRLERAQVTNEQGIAATASGTVPLSIEAPIDVDVALEVVPLSLANAVRPDLALDGTVTGTASVEGTLTAPTGSFDLAATGVTAAPLASNGIAPLDIAAAGELAEGVVRLERAEVTNDQGIAANASGTVPLSIEAPIDVDVALEAVPLSLANAVRPDLALDGTVTGTASVEGTLTAPTGSFDLAAENVTAAPLASNGIDPIAATIAGDLRSDAVTLRNVDISNGQGLRASASGTVPLSTDGPIDVNVSVETLPLSVAGTVRPELELTGTISGDARVGGTLAAPRGTFALNGRDVSVAPLRANGIAPLDVDIAGSSDGRSVRLDRANVSNGQGVSASASGTLPLSLAGPIDLDVRLDDVPLSIANAARPDLALSGTVSGSATVAGTLAAPQASFAVDGRSVSAAPLRAQGIAAVDVAASGSADGTRLVLERARLTNGQGIALSASGTVPFDPNGAIDVDVTLEALPLGALGGGDRAALGLGGSLTGSASVGGSISDPSASFSIDGAGITAGALRDAGLAPLGLSVDGSFADGTVRLASARATNGQGIDVSASGSAPLDGRGLSVQLDATAPLSLADRFLIDRGARLGGLARFSGSVTGSLGDPSVNGLVSTQGATFIDPLTNLRLPSLDVLASVNDNVITLNNARGVLGTGGTVAASGTIDLLGPGIPANLTITLDDARYTDGENIVTTVDGLLTVTGGLAASPLVAGTIEVIETNITVPESLGGSADVLDVRHFKPPVPVMRTLERARVDLAGSGRGAAAGSSPSGVRLDVLINAPNRIFIRGRGLDAEVGGRVLLRGPVSDVRPTGEFELIRGRLSILTQRITLDRGTVTLIGDLDPLLDFRATTVSGGATITVSVTGRVSDLEVTFSSDPDLPEDEVLARLIFDRGLDELSPLQIARLAAAAAELAGRGGTSVFDELRAAAGLDDLDITTDAEGNAAVRAGRYINDNIYLGVEAGQGGGRVTVDLDITDDLKARASTGADESTIGIFFEKDF